MAASRSRTKKLNDGGGLRAPYLRRISLTPPTDVARDTYPFCLPIFTKPFAVDFESSVTIVVGENGSGKSTFLEGIAALVGFDEAGGGAGYRPVDHSKAVETMGGKLSSALKASWLPKMNKGWFFRAESFFSVSRYLDQSALDVNMPPPDFLSYSHGEGFLRFFEERCRYKGIYLFDEPESALSPARQIEFLRLIRQMDRSGICQVIMATHAPMLMAYPDAQLLAATKYGFKPTTLDETEHYRLMREFYIDPRGFIDGVVFDDETN